MPLSTNPDSSIFGNVDAGSVKGIEFLVEREFARGWGARVSYALQEATANSSDAFFIRRGFEIDPVTGDTTFPAKVEFPLDFDRRHSLTAIVTGTTSPRLGPMLLGVRPLAGFEATAIFRYASGLPFSRTNTAGDSILGLPNDGRLPSTSVLDVLLRRPLRFGAVGGSIYLDVRNILNRRNVIAVRRDTGKVQLTEAKMQELADSAYQANPSAIPYESPRYRGWADLDNNGYVDGAAELQPLFLAAARDFFQPIFYYGAPRLVRIGMEFTF